jgi:hypothetical protein
MKQPKLLSLLFLIVLSVCMVAGSGCKSKDPKKAEACLKSATASMDDCKSCCKEAGYNGYSWTSSNCRCM